MVESLKKALDTSSGTSEDMLGSLRKVDELISLFTHLYNGYNDILSQGFCKIEMRSSM